MEQSLSYLFRTALSSRVRIFDPPAVAARKLASSLKRNGMLTTSIVGTAPVKRPRKAEPASIAPDPTEVPACLYRAVQKETTEVVILSLILFR